MFQVGCFQPGRKLDRSQRAAAAQRTLNSMDQGLGQAAGSTLQGLVLAGDSPEAATAASSCPPACMASRPSKYLTALRYVPGLSLRPDGLLLSPGRGRQLHPSLANGEGKGMLAM